MQKLHRFVLVYGNVNAKKLWKKLTLKFQKFGWTRVNWIFGKSVISENGTYFLKSQPQNGPKKKAPLLIVCTISFSMEREAVLSQSQLALKPRAVVGTVNRTPSNALELKPGEVHANKAIEDAKERMEQFKLQKNMIYKKNLEQCVTPTGKATLQSPGDANMRRIVTSTPISGNSQIIKLISKPSPSKYLFFVNS